MRDVLRVEKKYLISIDEFYKYSHYFSEFLLQDPHNGAQGYIVRSLYFDTLEEKDFNEKENGLEVRRKMRLRVYDPKVEYASLEMKQKQGANQLKRSLRLYKDDAYELTKGNYKPLLKYKEPFAAECYGLMSYSCYQPKAIVQYNRKAFIGRENNTRITFDHNIIATESNFDLFDCKLNMYPVFDPFNVVLEVKYSGFLLSYVRDAINCCNKSELSVSKYSLSRSVGLNYIF